MMMLLFPLLVAMAVAQNLDPNHEEINLQIDFMDLKLNDCTGDVVHMVGRRDTLYKRYVQKWRQLNGMKARFIKHCVSPDALVSDKKNPKINELEEFRFQILNVKKRVQHCLGSRVGAWSYYTVFLPSVVTPVYWNLELELAQLALRHFQKKIKDCLADQCSNQSCQNGGTCETNNGGYQCFCLPGYLGQYCQNKNPCSIQPCPKDCTCEVAGGGYNCTCRAGYFRRNCQKQGCEVVSIGSGQLVASANRSDRSDRSGPTNWMKDPVFPTSQTVYTNGESGWEEWQVNSLFAYSNINALKSNNVYKVYSLPVVLAGTGQVVYNGSLYGNIQGSNVLLQYNLQSGTTQRLTLTGAGYGRQCPYTWGDTDIEFAADEYGLWVIYGAVGDCRMKLARIEPSTFTIERTWTATWSKRNLGNAFMVCGKLYVLKYYVAYYYHDQPNYIIHTLDTNTNQSETLGPNRLPFTVSGDGLYSMSYNKNDKMLYTWETSLERFCEGTRAHYCLYRYRLTLD